MKPDGPQLWHDRRATNQGRLRSLRSGRAKSRYLTLEVHLRAVLEKLQTAAEKNLDSDEVAALFHVSYPHLTRLLKCAGLPPPIRQIRIIRLIKAARRLERESTSLEELASEFGYANAGSLRRAFRRILGRSVSQIRSGTSKEK